MAETIEVRELVAKLGLEVDESTFVAAEKLITGLKTGLFAAVAGVAAAVTGMVAFGKSTADAAFEAKKAALRTGVSTDAIQELGFAAEAAGVPVETLETALIRMNRASYAARTGSAEAAKAFHGLLTLKDLKELSPDEQLEKLAEGFIKIKDPGERTNKILTVMGRSAAGLIPLLAKGKDGIAEFREEAHELGKVLSEEDIKNAEEFRLNLHKTEASLTGLRNQIGATVLGGLVQFQRWMQKVIKSFKEWRAEHAEAVARTIRLAVAALAAAMLGYAAVSASAIAGTIAGWATMAAASVAAAATVVASWAAAALPFLPLALAVGLAALALEDIYGFLHGEDSVTGQMVSDIKYLKSEWEGFWNLLKDIKVWIASSVGLLNDNGLAAYARARFGGGGAGATAGTTGGSAPPGYIQSGTTRGGEPTFVHAPTVNVQVHASPGMDERALAQKTSEMIAEQINKITREAMAATR